MPHDHHEHGPHSHRAAGSKRRLSIALVLAAGYMLAEIIGGLVTNSLALLADAGHMLADVAAIALSLAAMWIAERPPSTQRTYGYYRAEILAALVNGATLIAIAIYILVEAVGRLREPPAVAGGMMLAIAAGGLVVNLLMLWILHEGQAQSLNVRGAWLHVLTDTLGSVGTIAAAALIWMLGWNWSDPAISILIALLVVYSAWALLRESVNVLMESAPSGIDVDQVRDSLMSVDGVTAVHDLHVWTITSGLDALSAHVVTTGSRSASDFLSEIREAVHERFGIDHVTVQIEPEGFEECAGGCEPIPL